MEEKGKYGKAWIEGFTKAAMANGADAETTKALLKVAATLEKMRDPEFVEGLSKQAEAMGVDKDVILNNLLIKEAGIGSFFNPRNSPILRAIMGMGAKAAPGAAGSAAGAAAKGGASIPIGWMGSVIKNPVGAAGLTGAGILGYNALNKTMERNMGRDKYGRQYYDLAELMQSGAIDDEEGARMLQNMMINRARGTLNTFGYNENQSRNPYRSWFGS